MSIITVRHNLSARFGPVRDQGGRETCLAFAMSDAHAAILNPVWSPLSCEYLFYHAKVRDQSPAEQGTTIAAICAALEHDGQPLEVTWPYLATLPLDIKKWKPPASVGQLFRRNSLAKPGGFDLIWNAVEAGDPTLIGMTFSDAFYAPDAHGVVDADEPTDTNRRHAVVAVGTGFISKARFVLVRNSWSDSWGLSGYAWISERYLHPRILTTVNIL